MQSIINLKDICDKLKKDVLNDMEFKFSDREYLIYVKGFLQDVYSCTIKLYRNISMQPTGYALIIFNDLDKQNLFLSSYKEFIVADD